LLGLDTDLPWICPSPTKLLQELGGSSLLGAVAVVCVNTG